jgi:ABC-type transport system involved in multi-copper enzyme maturation permease subunit
MIRFAWTRFRTQALVGAGVLGIAGAVLLVTGIQLNHAYYAAAAVCKQQGNCAHMFTYTFPSQGYLDAGNELSALTLAVPALIGMFWGAPLAAREFETGTFRLAWTQGVTRTRWLAAKLAIAGAAAIAVGELFTLMVHWWSSPIHKANPGYTEFTAGSFHTGIAPAGYATFAFALGVTAGLLIRRTLPAMAVTLAIYTAVIIAFPVWVRPHLIPPAQTTSTLSLASIANMPAVGASNGHLFLVPGSAAAPPGAWVISSSQLTTPDGRAPSSEPAGPCAGPASQPGPAPTPPSPAAAQACNDYIASLHLRQTVTYQPASRYWAFQLVETAIYLALALALAGFCFWWIRPARSAERHFRSARPSPPALALRSSP